MRSLIRILLNIAFLFSLSLSFVDASFFKSRAAHGTKGSARFVKITPELKRAMSFPVCKSQLYSEKLAAQLPFNHTLLRLANINPDVQNCNWSDFKEHWHPFLYRNRVQVLERGFPLPQLPQVLAQRSLRINHYLDPNFVPKNFSGSEMEKWLNAYREAVQIYERGQLGLDVFFLDLLRRKIRSALSYLSESEQSSLEVKFPDIVRQLDDEALYSIEELSDYFLLIDSRIGKNSERPFVFYPTPKGVSIVLGYERGVLTSASIPGLPSVDALSLVGALSHVPKISQSKSTFNVKGKLFLNTRSLESLNAIRLNEGKPAWVDAHQAIIDSITNADEPNKALEMKLECVFEELGRDRDEGKKLVNPLEHRKALIYEGLPVVCADKYMEGTWDKSASIITFLGRNEFDTESVNIVMKDGIEKEKFNIPSGRYKFVPEVNSALVESINFQVLDNGNIIAVVYAKSIDTKGSKNYRFVIGSAGELRKKNIQVGDEIKVVAPRSGLSPYIYKSLANGSPTAADYPSRCPQCNARLEFIRKNGTVQACCRAHLSCQDESAEDILRFTSQQGLNIPSLTKGIIEELKKKFKAFSPLDLMSLNEGDFLAISGIDQQVFAQLLFEIKSAKHTTLPRFLFAINIPGVDIFVAEALSRHFGTLRRLKSASREDLNNLEGVSNKAAQGVYEYFNTQENEEKLNKFLVLGVDIREPDLEFQNLIYKNTDECREEDYKSVVRKIRECDSLHSLSDSEYDQLCEFATKLEEKHPKWKVDRGLLSATDLPRLAISDPFKLVKTYSLNDVERLCEKHIVGDGFAVEPKVNGVACLLTYENGKFTKASTKRTKEGGVDITQHVLDCPSIPKLINDGFSGLIRGELYITRANLKKVNNFRQSIGESAYVDGLSLVVGNLNTRQKAKVSTRSLIEFYPYDYASHKETEELSSRMCRKSLNAWFRKVGFTSEILSMQKLFINISEVKHYLQAVQSVKHDFKVDIDGLVIKSASDTRAKTSCAYKFELETLTSSLVDIRFSLGKSGRLTAVAMIEPLKFQSGRTVSSVHIPDIFQVRNLPKRSKVVIQHSSGSAPQLKEFKPISKRSDAKEVFVLPKECPTCHLKLHETKSFSECRNPRCNKVNMQVLLKFAKDLRISNRVCLEKYIRTLIQEDLVHEFEDFYRITIDDILSKTSLDLEEANTVIASISASLNTTPSAFMSGLRIANIGEKTYKKILEKLSWKTMVSWREVDLLPYIPRAKSMALLQFIQKNREGLEFCLEKVELAHKALSQSQEDQRASPSDFARRIRSQYKIVSNATEQIRRAVERVNFDLTQMLLHLEKTDAEFASWAKIVKRDAAENQKLLEYLDKYLRNSDTYSQDEFTYNRWTSRRKTETPRVTILENDIYDHDEPDTFYDVYEDEEEY